MIRHHQGSLASASASSDTGETHVCRASSLQPPASSLRRRPRWRGVTLIEMLVAMTISLIMMAAVANMFAVVGSSVSASRALINVSEQLRNARNLMQSDLYGITACAAPPPLRPELGLGYLEYYEGQAADYTRFNTNPNSVAPNVVTWKGAQMYGQPGDAVDTLSGDADDVLMFTTRSKTGQPFIGKIAVGAAYTTLESQTAEVVWYAIQNGRTIPLTDISGKPPAGAPATLQLYTLYRRVLLVAPQYNNYAVISTTGANGSIPFFYQNDLSAHIVAASGNISSPVMVLNSLSDLTKRENRFAHDSISGQAAANLFPLYLNPPGQPATYLTYVPPNNMQGLLPFPAAVPANVTAPSRVGEDVVLNNVLAFDVKLFDPTVPLYAATTNTANTVALQPSDVGYWSATGNNVLGYGGYVDLGYAYWYTVANNVANPTNYYQWSTFAGPPFWGEANSHLSAIAQWSALTQYTGSPGMYGSTYDTWSLHYEGPGLWNSYTNYNTTPNAANNGINGINGFDDDNQNGVDDPGEFQYPPPYTTPLRGLQVKIRVYEPDSKQVREVTVVQDFVP